MEKDDLNQFITIMKDWIPADASIAIAINSHYLYYRSGKHDIRIKKGQLVEKGSIAQSVFTTKDRVEGLMDNSIFGIPYYGIGYPIHVNNQDAALIIILPTSYHFLKKEPLTFLTGKTNHDWFPVPIEEIAYIESKQKKTWFYAKEIGYNSIYTLKDLTYTLPNSFIRVHRSFIVNIKYIEKISRDFSSAIQINLKDGTIIPVSQTYSGKVRNKLGF